KSAGLSYHVAVGEAVFYGPKIDIKLTDAIGRSWQCSTIQFDFNLPRRFDVKYVGSDGQEHQVFMIHRALLGSLERFFATLIEHYGGDFPLWLAPVQARLITIADAQIPYAEEIRRILLDRGIRVEADLREEKMGAKIRDAEVLDKRVPSPIAAEGIADGRTMRNGGIVRPHSFDPPASLHYLTPR